MPCTLYNFIDWFLSFFLVAGDPVLPTAVVARIFHVMLMSVWDSHIFRIRKVIPIICFAPPPTQKKNNYSSFHVGDRVHFFLFRVEMASNPDCRVFF